MQDMMHGLKPHLQHPLPQRQRTPPAAHQHGRQHAAAGQAAAACSHLACRAAAQPASLQGHLASLLAIGVSPQARRPAAIVNSASAALRSLQQLTAAASPHPSL
jgi:hypothetical protein